MSNQSKKRSPIVRIGIDLDQIVVTEDGILTPDGFEEFVTSQREAGAELLLYGRFGQEIVPELEKLGFFTDMGFSKEDLRLFGDDAAKHADIRAAKLSHYIAGDARIFESRHFTRRAQPILFSYMYSDDYPTFADWPSVSNCLNWHAGLRKQTRSQLRKIDPIKEYGDNFVYKLYTDEKNPFILKRYYEKGANDHNRLKTEVRTLNAFKACKIADVPQPLWNDGNDWTLFNYVKGKDVEDVQENDVNHLIAFLINLDKKGKVLRSRRLPPAADARLTLKSYLNGISKLWNAVLGAVQRRGPQDALLFMMTDMEQLRQDNINHFYLWCKREKWDQEATLASDQQIVSPGDFGFHNAIRRPNGKLTFVDFEYSGWDDPAKLIADFFYNTSNQNLDMDSKLRVLNAFVQHREWDTKFLKRFWAVSDLVAVEWILRRLYVVVPEEQNRLLLADPSLNIKELIKERLAEAEDLRKNYQPMEHLCNHAQLLTGDELKK